MYSTDRSWMMSPHSHHGLDKPVHTTSRSSSLQQHSERKHHGYQQTKTSLSPQHHSSIENRNSHAFYSKIKTGSHQNRRALSSQEDREGSSHISTHQRNSIGGTSNTITDITTDIIGRELVKRRRLQLPPPTAPLSLMAQMACGNMAVLDTMQMDRSSSLVLPVATEENAVSTKDFSAHDPLRVHNNCNLYNGRRSPETPQIISNDPSSINTREDNDDILLSHHSTQTASNSKVRWGAAKPPQSLHNYDVKKRDNKTRLPSSKSSVSWKITENVRELSTSVPERTVEEQLPPKLQSLTLGADHSALSSSSPWSGPLHDWRGNQITDVAASECFPVTDSSIKDHIDDNNEKHIHRYRSSNRAASSSHITTSVSYPAAGDDLPPLFSPTSVSGDVGSQCTGDNIEDGVFGASSKGLDQQMKKAIKRSSSTITHNKRRLKLAYSRGKGRNCTPLKISHVRKQDNNRNKYDKVAAHKIDEFEEETSKTEALVKLQLLSNKSSEENWEAGTKDKGKLNNLKVGLTSPKGLGTPNHVHIPSSLGDSSAQPVSDEAPSHMSHPKTSFATASQLRVDNLQCPLLATPSSRTLMLQDNRNTTVEHATSPIVFGVTEKEQQEIRMLENELVSARADASRAKNEQQVLLQQLEREKRVYSKTIQMQANGLEKWMESEIQALNDIHEKDHKWMEKRLIDMTGKMKDTARAAQHNKMEQEMAKSLALDHCCATFNTHLRERQHFLLDLIHLRCDLLWEFQASRSSIQKDFYKKSQYIIESGLAATIKRWTDDFHKKQEINRVAMLEHIKEKNIADALRSKYEFYYQLKDEYEHQVMGEMLQELLKAKEEYVSRRVREDVLGSLERSATRFFASSVNVTSSSDVIDKDVIIERTLKASTAAIPEYSIYNEEDKGIITTSGNIAQVGGGRNSVKLEWNCGDTTNIPNEADFSRLFDDCFNVMHQRHLQAIDAAKCQIAQKHAKETEETLRAVEMAHFATLCAQKRRNKENMSRLGKAFEHDEESTPIEEQENDPYLIGSSENDKLKDHDIELNGIKEKQSNIASRVLNSEVIPCEKESVIEAKVNGPKIEIEPKYRCEEGIHELNAAHSGTMGALQDELDTDNARHEKVHTGRQKPLVDMGSSPIQTPHFITHLQDNIQKEQHHKWCKNNNDLNLTTPLSKITGTSSLEILVAQTAATIERQEMARKALLQNSQKRLLETQHSFISPSPSGSYFIKLATTFSPQNIKDISPGTSAMSPHEIQDVSNQGKELENKAKCLSRESLNKEERDLEMINSKAQSERKEISGIRTVSPSSSFFSPLRASFSRASDSLMVKSSVVLGEYNSATPSVLWKKSPSGHHCEAQSPSTTSLYKDPFPRGNSSSRRGVTDGGDSREKGNDKQSPSPDHNQSQYYLTNVARKMDYHHPKILNDTSPHTPSTKKGDQGDDNRDQKHPNETEPVNGVTSIPLSPSHQFKSGNNSPNVCDFDAPKTATEGLLTARNKSSNTLITDGNKERSSSVSAHESMSPWWSKTPQEHLRVISLLDYLKRPK